jgi:hypothetical protein
MAGTLTDASRMGADGARAQDSNDAALKALLDQIARAVRPPSAWACCAAFSLAPCRPPPSGTPPPAQLRTRVLG